MVVMKAAPWPAGPSTVDRTKMTEHSQPCKERIVKKFICSGEVYGFNTQQHLAALTLHSL